MRIGYVLEQFPKLSEIFLIVLLVGTGLLRLSFDGIFAGHPELAITFKEPLRSNSDMAYQAAMALKVNDSSLFSKDTLLNMHLHLYPKPFIWLLAKLFVLFGDVKTTYILLCWLINALFLVGLYLVFFEFTKSKFVAFLSTLLATTFCLPAFAGSAWGIIPPETTVPRSFIVALSPLLFLLFWRWFESSRLPLLFLLLGFLTNLHPLSALHLVAIFGLALLIQWGFSGKVLQAVAPFLLGAIPSVLHQFSSLDFSNTTSLEILRARNPQVFPPSWRETFLIGCYLLVPLTLGLWGFVVRKRKGLEKADFFWLRLFFSTVLISLSIFVLQFFSSLLSLQPLRVTCYFYFYSFVYIGFLLVHLLSEKGFLGKLLIPIVCLVLYFPVGDSLANYQLADLTAPRQLRKSEVSFAPDWASFYDLATWAAANTVKSSLFLVPPDGFSIFRIFAKRGVYVTDKDGCAVVLSGSYARLWDERYRAIKTLYDNESLPEILTKARGYGVDYIITRVGDFPPNTGFVYQNNKYIVWKVQ